MENSLKLISNSKIFQIPTRFKHMNEISINIWNILIFEHQYEIKSKVNEIVLQGFIHYLIEDQYPDIKIDNIDEYSKLSEEFEILQDYISNKRTLFGEYLINITNIQQIISFYFICFSDIIII